MTVTLHLLLPFIFSALSKVGISNFSTSAPQPASPIGTNWQGSSSIFQQTIMKGARSWNTFYPPAFWHCSALRWRSVRYRLPSCTNAALKCARSTAASIRSAACNGTPTMNETIFSSPQKWKETVTTQGSLFSVLIPIPVLIAKSYTYPHFVLTTYSTELK